MATALEAYHDPFISYICKLRNMHGYAAQGDERCSQPSRSEWRKPVSNKLQRCLNLSDLHDLAKQRLPGPIYSYLERGADDEYSLRNNTAAFDYLQIKARSLADVGRIDTCTQVLGQTLDWPVFLSPTGMTRMFHSAGELAAARAAQQSGTLYTA